MSAVASKAVRREAYRAPGFLIDRVELVFELDAHDTRVESTLTLRRNPAAAPDTPLELDGDGITLESIRLDGAPLADDAWRLSEDGRRITIAAATLDARGGGAALSIVSHCHPAANLALEGLYLTGDTFCTQCEAEGFRRITWYPDRPDVLAEFFVTIRADRGAFPVLLANGNRTGERALPDGRHEVRWHDPFPKPCYLFALVAGKLDCLRDRFTTASGRHVALEIHSTGANLPRARWAMDCLKAAMRWDEEAYGREYDLDLFMIYAADDFNMGAMENKGLNIFNSRYLLADRDTATDTDFLTIDAIVAHEYFHNWSGNRVTCRDWFQLSLKEGFTVFREQQYTASRASPAVVRIDETAFMQSRQFAQDAGPMAHPIRPDEYEAIDNFYTVTVYEKGAEVIRMLHTLLGAEAFRRGTDLYFARHDGTAATCDDFVAAMADASGQDLSQFKRWYSQAGTPRVTVRDSFDGASSRYTLHLTQSTPPTPGQAQKLPMTIPLAVALVHENGDITHEQVLRLTQAEQSFSFEGVAAKPIPSLLRAFSAPVAVAFDHGDAQLAALVVRDSDGVVRWQALRTLFFRACDAARHGQAMPAAFDHAIDGLLTDAHTDPALIAHLLTFPSAAELAEREHVIDPVVIADARDAVLRHVAVTHGAALIERYGHERIALAGRPWSVAPADVAHRALSGVLVLLANLTPSADAQRLCAELWASGDNLTDRLAALNALRDQPCALRDEVYSAFHDRWQDDLSMLNRWFALEASARRDDAVARARALLAHPKFDAKNPNRVRAVVQAFGDQNWRGLHAADGSGYAFIAEQILRFDAQNPSLAARFCDVFSRWHRLSEPARTLQRDSLTRLAAAELSTNVREIIGKTLQSGGDGA